MSNLVDYAKSELERAGLFDDDANYGGMLGEAVMRMIQLFAKEGHSGFSAQTAISIFQRLARYKPLTPLTGEESEWNEVAENIWQNNRYSSVFKDEDGKPYDIDARVFRDPDGCTYTSNESRVYIEFPYMPGDPEIVDRPSEE